MEKKKLSNPINQKLEGLRATYKKNLAVYQTELEEIWWSTQNNPSQIEKLSSIAHRLAGSGKAYGFAELSQLAHELELACNAVKNLNQQELRSAISAPLQALLSALKRDSGRISENDLPEELPTLDSKQGTSPDSITLLLIDDDPDFSAQLSETLSHRGYCVHCHQDIKKLDSAVAQYAPLALIVDMDFSGKRFAGADQVGLWRQKDGSPLPVIFVSSFDSFELRLAAVRAGGNHFLRKPLDVTKLVSLLQSELNLAPSEPYRVMVVDDDHDLLSLYESVLTNAGYSVSTATNADLALALLEQIQPELVLIDIHMPVCNGIELGRIIRQHEEFATIPLLFMSVAGDADIQLACARLTNDEFINKPIEPWRLLMVVKSRVSRGRLLRSQTGTLTVSEAVVGQDSLTGLPKLAKIRSVIERAMHQSTIEKKLAVLKIDIRDFHTINNLYGYYFGDQVLQRFAWELTQCLKNDDILCRESADEFILLTTGHDSQESIDQYIKTLIKAVEKTNHAEKHSNIALSIDIGVALAKKDTRNADELLDHADTALFKAKKATHANTCYYGSSMKQKEKARFVLTQSIKQALESYHFFPAFQPIFAVVDNQLVGFEALARWQHPERGMLGPGEFIPLMEEQGLISQLTEQMLTHALSQLAKWQMKHPQLFMSLNLSAQDIQKPLFLSHLKSLIDDYGLTASRIVLEITESLLLSDWQQANQVIRSLKALGVRLALDDFGTGYSSLSYLHRIDAAKLKIDRSFIQHWSQTGDARLLRSMVQLGQTMNMSVIAEGVEEIKELNFLNQLGCNQYQGFLTAKPMFADEVERHHWI